MNQLAVRPAVTVHLRLWLGSDVLYVYVYKPGSSPFVSYIYVTIQFMSMASPLPVSHRSLHTQNVL